MSSEETDVPKSEKLMLYVPVENHEILLDAFGTEFEENSGRALYAMRACTRLFNTRIAEWLAPSDLDPVAINVLIWLYAARDGKGVAVTELGRYIHSAGPNLTAKISAIEAKGLVTRTINPDDRRSILVKLTKAGRGAMERAFPLHARNLNRAFSGLTIPERKQLLGLLIKVGEGVQDAASFETAPTKRKRPAPRARGA